MGFKEIRTNLREKEKIRLHVQNLVFLVVCKIGNLHKNVMRLYSFRYVSPRLYMLMFIYTPSPQGNEGILKTYYCCGLFLCNLSPMLFWKLFYSVGKFGIAGCLKKKIRQDFTLRYHFKVWSSREEGKVSQGIISPDSDAFSMPSRSWSN